jgi:plasmid maintenance system killer protein
MKVRYGGGVAEALSTAPAAVQKAFFKQMKFLKQNLHHPSLRVKKYDEATDRWQGRVNKDWRFYFKIEGDTYFTVELIPHPK